MASTTATISDNLRALMGIRQATVTALARELGVARNTASLYVNGKQPMNTDQLAAAARWLGVEVHEFFREEVYKLSAA
ncbi:helix-turn-helix domain-containing protein [Rothia sp. P5764]|uniref:helix-turn-helix domain-containing protein n=1 Tax=Rothia sp. P5764 TaxID=3402654 RepID=UPI003ACFF5B7